MRFKVGEKYTIQFLDHCKGDAKILCEITIWVTRQDDDFVWGTWWKILGEDKETEDINNEIVSIIKSTITKKRKLQLI